MLLFFRFGTGKTATTAVHTSLILLHAEKMSGALYQNCVHFFPSICSSYWEFCRFTFSMLISTDENTGISCSADSRVTRSLSEGCYAKQKKIVLRIKACAYKALRVN
jgi:hypothetical protein